MSLFLFYKFSLVLTLLSGGTLAIIGKHFYSRGYLLEVFFLSQMALIGNLTAKLLFHTHDFDWFGMLLSYAFFALGKIFIHFKSFKPQEHSTYMIGGYLALLSFQYLLIGYFPQLDAHMNIGFFGNIVTSSSEENLLLFTVLLGFASIYYAKKKQINRHTLEINILNRKDKSLLELCTFSIPLITCLYNLGFLYTMSFLLLPALLIGKSFRNEKQASLVMVLLAAISSFVGLSASIYFERLSTTPTQILILCLLLLLIRSLSRK